MSAYLILLKDFGARLLARVLPRLGKAAEKAVDEAITKVEQNLDEKLGG